MRNFAIGAVALIAIKVVLSVAVVVIIVGGIAFMVFTKEPA